MASTRGPTDSKRQTIRTAQVASYQHINVERTMGDITRCHCSGSYATNNNIILFSSRTLAHSEERLQTFRAAREHLIAETESHHVENNKPPLLSSVWFPPQADYLENTVTAVKICGYFKYTIARKDVDAFSEWCLPRNWSHFNGSRWQSIQ